jgi:hypothetical protein
MGSPGEGTVYRPDLLMPAASQAGTPNPGLAVSRPQIVAHIQGGVDPGNSSRSNLGLEEAFVHAALA